MRNSKATAPRSPMLLWLFFGLIVAGFLVKPGATFIILALFSPVILILALIWVVKFLTGRKDANNTPERSALWTLIDGFIPW